MISFRVFNDYDHGLLKWSNTSHISCRRACNTPRIFCQLLTFMLMMMQSIWRRGESVDDRVWPKDSSATTWPHSLCQPEHSSSSSLNLQTLILKIFNLLTRVNMRKETAALLDRNLFIFQLDATWVHDLCCQKCCMQKSSQIKITFPTVMISSCCSASK